MHCKAFVFFKPIIEQPKWVFYSLRKDTKFCGFNDVIKCYNCLRSSRWYFVIIYAFMNDFDTLNYVEISIDDGLWDVKYDLWKWEWDTIYEIYDE